MIEVGNPPKTNWVNIFQANCFWVNYQCHTELWNEGHHPSVHVFFLDGLYGFKVCHVNGPSDGWFLWFHKTSDSANSNRSPEHTPDTSKYKYERIANWGWGVVRAFVETCFSLILLSVFAVFLLCNRVRGESDMNFQTTSDTCLCWSKMLQ